MKSILCLYVALITAASSFSCHHKKSRVDYLLARHAEAMGGKDHWATLRSYRQTFVRPGGSTMVMTCLMPDRITLEFHRGEEHLIKGYDGLHGYLVRNGEYEPMRPGEAVEMAEEMHYYSELIFAGDEGYEIKNLGEEAVDGIPCYKLAVRKSEKDEQIYWLNQETFLIEQTGEFSEDRAHAGIYYKTRLQDYRSVEGYRFPFKQTLIPSNRAPIVSDITDVRVNEEGMSAELFAYAPDNTVNMVRYWQDRYRADRLQGFTFVQETIQYQKDTPDTSTWYEAIRYPDLFRIDFGEKSDLNRNLYRHDSVYVLRNGKEVHRGKQVQEFMIMEGSLYDYPVDSTLSKLRQTGVDPDLFYRTTYRDRPTFVVGSTPEDLGRPQVWLDAERRHTVRRIGKTKDGKTLEVQYDDFQLIDGHYIESSLRFLLDGVLIQTERYYNIEVEPGLAPSVFDPEQYQRTYWY